MQEASDFSACEDELNGGLEWPEKATFYQSYCSRAKAVNHAVSEC